MASRLRVGAVLKKIKFLGFGGPGLKIHVLKEHSPPAPVLEGEGRIYNIFGVRAFLNFWEIPENTQNDVFLGAFNGASGVERWISGFFRASGNQKSTFLNPRKVPPSGRAPCPFFLRPKRPLVGGVFGDQNSKT